MTRLCPSCAGVVGAAAEWCGLCFADLRAGARPPSYAGSPPSYAGSPAPAAGPTSPAGPVPAATVEAPPGSPGEPVGPAPGDPADDAPAPPALVVLPLVDPPAPVGAVGPGWPCSVCSSVVPYEADTCPVCGAGFLSALTGIGIPRLPVVGAASAGGRRLIWVAAAVVFAALGMLLLLALGLAGRLTG